MASDAQTAQVINDEIDFHSSARTFGQGSVNARADVIRIKDKCFEVDAFSRLRDGLEL